MESKHERPVDWNLLSRYVAGSCSEKEEVVVETWAAATPENRRTLDELRRVWKKVSLQKETLPVDVEALWDELDERIREAEGERQGRRKTTLKESRRASRRTRTRRPRSGTWSRRLVSGALSAVVIATIALATIVLWEPTDRGDAPNPKVFTTERGQRATVRLPDGTRVRLNVDSRLAVLPTFGKNKREVRLDGEAFLQVVRDTTRPFTVYAGGVTTRVLGTAFDVHAYPGEEMTSVAVAEGRVAVRPVRPENSQEETREVVLESRELGQVHRQSQNVLRRTFDRAAHLAWMDGKLVFRDASFGEVLRKLERWYGLEISLRDGTSPPDGELNTRFAKDQPLPEVLDLVGTLFGLEYQLNRKTVVFSSRT